MKTSAFVILNLFSFFALNSASAAEFKIENNFRDKKILISSQYDAPLMEKTRDGKLRIEMNNLSNTMEAGLPSVPFKTFKVMVPKGMEVDSINVVRLDQSNRVRGQVERSASQMPISWIGNRPLNLERSEAPEYVQEYPQNIFSFDQQYLHGVQVNLVNVYPVIEKNHTEIEVYSNIGLEITYKQSSRNKAKLFPHQREELRKFVDNAELLDGYSAREEGKPGLDYLVLATPKVMAYSGQNSLKDLLVGLSARGLNARIVSLSTVDAANGADRVEKIRNYIKQNYEEDGIQYVMLVGRSVKSDMEPYFPARTLWSKIRAYLGYWTTVEENIPADLYYASLDGTFNANGNDKWGELTDGENGNDVDFLPEISIGRVVIDSDAQLQNFVAKSLYTYMHKASEETALMGESLFPEMNLHGDDYMEQLVGECKDHNYSTSGYTNSWKLTKFYDKVSAWSGKSAQIAISKSEFSMINHLGHSNYNSNMKLNSSNISSFSNAKPFIFYTQGCLAGKYTVGSFVDKMVSTTNAAVAAVGNSTYGLAPEDPEPETTKTPGGSQMLHRQFINTVIAKKISSLGKAHQASKVAFIGLKNTQEIRWVNWTAHYFGDPSLELNF